MISQRWNGFIIHQLLNGPQRFCHIESSLPISGRLLSERLKELEHEGIIHRHVYPETPVRIEYSLTEKGRRSNRSLKEWKNGRRNGSIWTKPMNGKIIKKACISGASPFVLLINSAYFQAAPSPRLLTLA